MPPMFETQKSGLGAQITSGNPCGEKKAQQHPLVHSQDRPQGSDTCLVGWQPPLWACAGVGATMERMTGMATAPAAPATRPRLRTARREWVTARAGAWPVSRLI